MFRKYWVYEKTLLGHKNSITSLDFQQKGTLFATGSSDSTIRIWNQKNYKTLSILRGHLGKVQCVSFNKKYPCIFSGGDDLFVRSWDIDYNKELRKYKGHFASVTNFVFHPTLDIFFSSSQDNTIRIWDFRINKEIRILKFHSKTVTSLISNNESPHLISGGLDKKIFLWDLISGKTLACIKRHQHGIKQFLNIFNDLFFISLSGDALLFFRKDGLFMKKLKNPNKTNNCCSLSKKKEIALGHSFYGFETFMLDKEKAKIKLVEKRELNLKNNNCSISVIGFNKSGKKLYVAGKNHCLTIFKKKWKVVKN
mmetsp:Transcript_24183/g.46850  ORF Transcript_24183/g.46850 Transcript_24183/m.46850 type:complete len:310 (-) Transcript_24183:23-952(-)